MPWRGTAAKRTPLGHHCREMQIKDLNGSMVELTPPQIKRGFDLTGRRGKALIERRLLVTTRPSWYPNRRVEFAERSSIVSHVRTTAVGSAVRPVLLDKFHKYETIFAELSHTRVGNEIVSICFGKNNSKRQNLYGLCFFQDGFGIIV